MADVDGRLGAVVDEVGQVDLDAQDDAQLRALLAACESATRRLQALQTRVAGALTRRARAAAAAERPDDRRAPDRAAADVRRDLVDDLRLSPSQAKQLVADDRRLDGLPAARGAYEAGELSRDHLRILDRTLAGLAGEVRSDLEARLVEAAARQDPVAFGRTCRAALAELAPEEAMADLDRQHAQRSGRVTQRPDGMTHLAVDVAGVDGAFVHATLDAFRRPDARDEHRSPEQRTADAFMDLVRAAAGTIDDPNARHGRPIFHIQLPAETLLPADEVERLRAGNGHETFTGPLPLAELTRLLGDAHVAALLADADGLPLAVTEQKRGVPLGLWRQIVARDRGCIADGCDAPPGWCQVAHLAEWFADGGALSPGTAGLACTRHHRHFDRGQLDVSWIDGRPVLHRADRPPDRPSDWPPGRPPDPPAPTRAAERRGGYLHWPPDRGSGGSAHEAVDMFTSSTISFDM